MVLFSPFQLTPKGEKLDSIGKWETIRGLQKEIHPGLAQITVLDIGRFCAACQIG